MRLGVELRMPKGKDCGCPLVWLGLYAREDCGDCIYFMEMDGNEVICSCQEPIEEDVCLETSTS